MAFNKAYGLEKNAKLITVGPTSIPDSRVLTCFPGQITGYI